MNNPHLPLRDFLSALRPVAIPTHTIEVRVERRRRRRTISDE